jgi:hypothetical protein
MPTRRVTPLQFVDALQMMAADVRTVPLRAARTLAPVIVANVQAIMGTSALQDLAPDTQTERVRAGFTPNDPLVRTGDLRESVVPFSAPTSGVSALGVAMTYDPVAEYHEKGTAHIPPRPAFRMGLLDSNRIAQTILSNLVGSALGKRP